MAYNRRKRKVKKNVPEAVAHIHSTYNNTIVTIKDKEGNVLSWASAGTIGYKGSKKKTAGRDALDCGVKKFEVHVKGLGAGRENEIRQLQAVGLEVTSIVDETPIPHNGCRPPKRPRN